MLRWDHNYLVNLYQSLFITTPTLHLCALSSKVPPHLRPRASSADLSLSRPSDMSSEEDEKADRSRCAPRAASAPAASLGHPGNLVGRKINTTEPSYFSLLAQLEKLGTGRYQIVG